MQLIAPLGTPLLGELFYFTMHLTANTYDQEIILCAYVMRSSAAFYRKHPTGQVNLVNLGSFIDLL